MTTNVSIHNSPGHWNVKVFRRDIKTGNETEIGLLKPGTLWSHIAVWDDCEIVVREIPIIGPDLGDTSE